MSVCKHEDFACEVTVNRLEDTGRFSVDLRVTCRQCDEPFRFLHFAPGVSFQRAMVSIDGLELRAPMEPQGVPRLFRRGVIEMPPPTAADELGRLERLVLAAWHSIGTGGHGDHECGPESRTVERPGLLNACPIDVLWCEADRISKKERPS